METTSILRFNKKKNRGFFQHSKTFGIVGSLIHRSVLPALNLALWVMSGCLAYICHYWDEYTIACLLKKGKKSFFIFCLTKGDKSDKISLQNKTVGVTFSSSI